MNKFTAIVFCGSVVALSGCNADDGDFEKGVVDTEALEDNGGEVRLSGSTGRVTVPFIEPVPGTEDDDEDLEEQLVDAVSLTVESMATGTTAVIGGGDLVSGVPNSPGEYSWELNDDRDEAELTFYNETKDGITLKTTVEYEATLVVNDNDYVEEVKEFVFDVNPTD